MLSEQLEGYQQWVSTLPEIVQWLSIILASALPYIEIHGAVGIGVASGVNPVLSVILSIIGNFAIVFISTVFADRLNAKVGKSNDQLSPKRKKFNKSFEKYGVIGTAMLGWLILPSFTLSFLMVSVAKVDRKKVLFWMLMSILGWGVVAGIVSSFLFL